jgi:hypothetical protein
VPSRWRDEAAWNERLQRDRILLDERLSAEQTQVLTEIGRILGAGDPGDVLALDFVVVYGSYARGEHGADSDVDIYFEANLPRELNRTDHDRRYHVFGMPSGTLRERFPAGDEIAGSIASDGLVVSDRGGFRALLIAIDEEGA